MAVLTSTGITFSDATSQATSPVITLNGQKGTVVTTDLGAIGSTMAALVATNGNVAINGTIAGSSLRYSYTLTSGSSVGDQENTQWGALNGNRNQLGNGSYGGGGSALSGTWRRMDTGIIYSQRATCCGTLYFWGVGLFVRIS